MFLVSFWLQTPHETSRSSPSRASEGRRLVPVAGPGPRGARGQHREFQTSLPPPGSPSESPGREGLGWSGPGPQLPRAGLLPSHPRRGHQELFLWEGGRGPGTRETWALALASSLAAPAMLRGQVHGGVQAPISRIGQTGLCCPPPWGAHAPGPRCRRRVPQNLAGFENDAGQRDEQKSELTRGGGVGQGASTAGSSSGSERTVVPSLRAGAPLPGLGLERKTGAAPPFCACFQGTSGFRPFCIFESESLHSAVSGEEPAEM